MADLGIVRRRGLARVWWTVGILLLLGLVWIAVSTIDDGIGDLTGDGAAGPVAQAPA